MFRHIKVDDKHLNIFWLYLIKMRDIIGEVINYNFVEVASKTTMNLKLYDAE